MSQQDTHTITPSVCEVKLRLRAGGQGNGGYSEYVAYGTKFCTIAPPPTPNILASLSQWLGSARSHG